MVEVAFAVQHHPDRADLARQLLAELDDPAVRLVTDDGADTEMRSPWRTYRRCLEEAPPSATHVVVLQDDVLPCRRFTQAARLCVAARPDPLISFYVGGNLRLGAERVRRAARDGHSWTDIPQFSWFPAVAVSWPTALIPEFLSYVDAQSWPEVFLRSDDQIIGRWLSRHHRTPVATVPSLIDHPDDVPSLIGTRHRGGRDPGRVAVCWVGECDPAAVDWTV